MKILHIGKYYSPFSGGIENFMADLLAEQVKRGAHVRCLVHHHRAWQKMTREQIGGVEVVKVATFGRLLFTPLSPDFGRRLNYEISSFQPDILHVHVPNVSAFWLLWFMERIRIPIVLHWHSDVVSSEFKTSLALAYRFYRPFERQLLGLAASVIATSDRYANFSPVLQMVPDKVTVVPIGIADKAPPLPVPARSPETPLKVLCIGRLSYYKGHKYLVSAIQGYSDIEVTLVGEGDEKRRLQKQVTAMGLSERVRFTGHVDNEELHTMLSECDVLCLPSVERTEAFGVVILEAMRAGKPVVASNVEGSGIGWVVKDGETGLLVEPADPVDLAAALVKVRDNPELARKMGESGRQRFEELFTISRVADQLQDIYNRAL